MKKTLALILALVMMIALVPMSALAYEIGNVSLIVTEPEAHAYPVFEAKCVHEDGYVVDTEYQGSTNGVKWYDVTDEKNMTSSDRFIEGHEYTVTVILKPTAGNKFALDTGVGTHTAVNGMINGRTANVTLSYYSIQEVAVMYTFVLPGKVTSVDVTGLTAPVAGQKPSYKAEVNGDGYALIAGTEGNFQNGIYWFDLTDSKLAAKDTAFKEGHQYRVFLCLETESGFEFRTDAKANPLLDATVNGNKANAIKYLNEPASETVNVYYDFPACEAAKITSVEIDNLPIPEAGKAPKYSADIETEGLKLADINNTFTKNGIFWTNKARAYDLTPNSYFFSEHMYIATLRLDIEDGFSAGQSISATVNGQSAEAVYEGGQIIVKYEVLCPEYKIDKVDITDVTPPAIGNNPSEYMKSAEPNLYVVDSAAWYVDGSMMYDDDTYIAGKNYDLEVWVDRAQDGWDYTADFADKVSVTVNGNNVSEKKVERIGDSVKFTYTFTAAEAAKIGTVNVTGIDAPVAGNSPDYSAVVDSDTYMIDTSLKDKHTSDGVLWRNVTDGDAMQVGIDKFEEGSVYEVMITVTPYNGYTFVTGKDGTPIVTGTVNGETATEIMGRSDVEAIIVYKFPVTEAAPEEEVKEEVKPEEEVKTEEPKEEETTKPETKTLFNDVAKTAYYYEPVAWAVEEGITAGTTADTFSPNSPCTRGQVVTFLHRMVGSPPPAAISIPFGDVGSSAYYADSVKWAVGSKITSGTTADAFGPNDACTRAQVVTFLWRTAGQPTVEGANNPFEDVASNAYYYDAVMWAVEEGITGGTSADTFSPNEPCTRAQVVTFMYRLINS